MGGLMREEVPFQNKLSYWSSTTFKHHTKNAWIVMFDGAMSLVTIRVIHIMSVASEDREIWFLRII